jgi:glycosyltransferase involved in cell wall biosynthesis
MVSICCAAYNHVDFIREALDSFLSQSTTFDFEVLVNDDASTDGTAEILAEYAKSHPDIVRPLFHKTNQTTAGLRNINLAHNFPRARGKYLAMCDGDDFWTSPEKLQRQVEYLESHPDCALVFHPIIDFDDGQPLSEGDVFPSSTSNFTEESLARGNFVGSSSVVYRKVNYTTAQLNVMPADWYLHLYHARFGEIGFIDEPMSTHRRHSNGVFSGATPEQRLRFSGRDLLRLCNEFEQYYESTNLAAVFNELGANTIREMLQYLPIDEITDADFDLARNFLPAALVGEARNSQRLADEVSELRNEFARVQSAVEEATVALDNVTSSRSFAVAKRMAKLGRLLRPWRGRG